MGKLIFLAAALLLLSACGTYTKPGASEADVARDKAMCNAQAHSRVLAERPQSSFQTNCNSNTWTGNTNCSTRPEIPAGEGLSELAYFIDCMKANGYSRQSQSTTTENFASANQQMAAVNFKRQNLQAENRNMLLSMCANEAHKLYYVKTACEASGINFEQMADTSKISPAEREALIKVQNARQELRQLEREVIETYVPARSSKMLELLNSYYTKVDSVALDLANGKLTWGEYNKARKDLYDQQNLEMHKL
jgi:hypothetical protein